MHNTRVLNVDIRLGQQKKKESFQTWAPNSNVFNWRRTEGSTSRNATHFRIEPGLKDYLLVSYSDAG